MVRDRWFVPTFTQASPSLTAAWHHRVTAHVLITVNNWLKEGPVSLGFGRYWYPPSVETPTLDKRFFYASHPLGSNLYVYMLFKLLDVTGLVPNIYEKRGTQLLLVILYKYLLHFLTTLSLCTLVFFVCRKLDFDHLNSTLVGIIPAIVQFHNASTLYWNHFLYNEFAVVLLPCVLFILLEILRVICASAEKKAFDKNCAALDNVYRHVHGLVVCLCCSDCLCHADEKQRNCFAYISTTYCTLGKAELFIFCTSHAGSDTLSRSHSILLTQHSITI